MDAATWRARLQASSFGDPARFATELRLLELLDRGVALDPATVEAIVWASAMRATDAAGHAVALATATAAVSSDEVRQDESRQGSTDQAAVNTRDLMMAQLTEAFGEEMDVLRQEEGFGMNKVALLVDILETSLLTSASQAQASGLETKHAAVGSKPAHTGTILI